MSFMARVLMICIIPNAMTAEFCEVLFTFWGATWNHARAVEAKRSRVSASMRTIRPGTPNPRSALDARTALCFHNEGHWPGASESDR